MKLLYHFFLIIPTRLYHNLFQMRNLYIIIINYQLILLLFVLTCNTNATMRDAQIANKLSDDSVPFVISREFDNLNAVVERILVTNKYAPHGQLYEQAVYSFVAALTQSFANSSFIEDCKQENEITRFKRQEWKTIAHFIQNFEKMIQKRTNENYQVSDNISYLEDCIIILLAN